MPDDAISKRIKLNLDDLQVESFDTLPNAPSRLAGTVRAYDETDTCQLQTNPCFATLCQGTCEFTCAGTCDYTCQTCGGCGGGDTNGCGTGQSDGIPCDTNVGSPSCGTCGFTCSPACQSAFTYASCGGSCDETNCYGQGNCTNGCNTQ